MRRGRPMARSTLRTRSGGTLRHRRTAPGLIPHSTAIAFQSFFLAMYRIVASRGVRLSAVVPMFCFSENRLVRDMHRYRGVRAAVKHHEESIWCKTGGISLHI